MDLTRQLDGYCERLDPGLWVEPVNALTNAAFLVAAWIMWRRVRGTALGLAKALCIILALIGVGSFLFHTFAQSWAMIADVTPIALFVLVYIFAANRDYWGVSLVPALGLTALFFPFAAATLPLFNALPFFKISAGYWPIATLIALYAIALRRKLPQVARGLGVGAALLALSLTFRSLDMLVCPSLPLGTHFLWHILNAVMLGWMIETYRRHMLAGLPPGR